jgi:hypothetical protein
MRNSRIGAPLARIQTISSQTAKESLSPNRWQGDSKEGLSLPAFQLKPAEEG